MTPRGFRTTALAALLVAAFAAEARAQSKLPLRIEAEFPSNVSRTCGPVRLQLTFDWAGPGVLTGDLSLEARDASMGLLGTYVIENLYITEGQQSYEIMLPGMRVQSRDDSFTLTPTLVDKQTGKTSQLRDVQLLAPGEDKRKLVVAILEPEPDVGQAAPLDRRENDICDSLRLERLAPPQLMSPRVVTASVTWWAEDAPQEPLRYCACDILLLPDEGLRVLEQPVLDAILAWVRAGGGVCVVLDEEPLEREQIAWLNALISAPADIPVLLGDSEGRLIHELDGSAEISLQRRLGLGRVVVTVGPDQAHPRAPHWTRSAAFLWRLRHQHQQSIEDFGVWNHQATMDLARNAPQLGNTVYGEMESSRMVLASEFQPLPTLGLNGMIQRLLPDGVRLVPLPMMGLMLFLYLLAVGPLDYFVLGKLGMRKWTWCTFPAITLLFTGFSIGLSNRYMGSSVARREVVFRDVAPGGAIARENRLELLFPSRTGEMTTEIGRGLFTPTRYQDFAQFQAVDFDPRTLQPIVRKQQVDPAVFYGRMPTQCRVVQEVSQWTPQLNRLLTIPIKPPTDAPNFDWDEVPDFKSPEGLQRLRERISQSFTLSGSQQLQSGFADMVSAGVMHLGDSNLLLGDPSLFQRSTMHRVDVMTPYGMQQTHESSAFLWMLSVSNQPGFLGVVSEYAPAGGDRFEDLLMLDPTDPRQWLLVVMQPQGNDFHIYRRLYVLED
jgi:hypothetical protein